MTSPTTSHVSKASVNQQTRTGRHLPFTPQLEHVARERSRVLYFSCPEPQCSWASRAFSNGKVWTTSLEQYFQRVQESKSHIAKFSSHKLLLLQSMLSQVRRIHKALDLEKVIRSRKCHKLYWLLQATSIKFALHTVSLYARKPST